MRIKRRSAWFVPFGLIAIAGCTSDAMPGPDAPPVIPDAPLVIPDARLADAPTDAGPGCSVSLVFSPAHPVAPVTIHAELVVTSCSDAHPVAVWSVTGPDGMPIVPDINDFSLMTAFEAPTSGTYTVDVGYMLETRIVFEKRGTVDVAGPDAGL